MVSAINNVNGVFVFQYNQCVNKIDGQGFLEVSGREIDKSNPACTERQNMQHLWLYLDCMPSHTVQKKNLRQARLSVFSDLRIKIHAYDHLFHNLSFK